MSLQCTKNRVDIESALDYLFTSNCIWRNNHAVMQMAKYNAPRLNPGDLVTHLQHCVKPAIFSLESTQVQKWFSHYQTGHKITNSTTLNWLYAALTWVFLSSASQYVDYMFVFTLPRCKYISAYIPVHRVFQHLCK